MEEGKKEEKKKKKKKRTHNFSNTLLSDTGVHGIQHANELKLVKGTIFVRVEVLCKLSPKLFLELRDSLEVPRNDEPGAVKSILVIKR